MGKVPVMVGRVLLIAVTTIACAGIGAQIFAMIWNQEMLSYMGALVGGFFWFWFSYTGRLTRMFRKVEQRAHPRKSSGERKEFGAWARSCPSA